MDPRARRRARLAELEAQIVRQRNVSPVGRCRSHRRTRPARPRSKAARAVARATRPAPTKTNARLAKPGAGGRPSGPGGQGASRLCWSACRAWRRTTRRVAGDRARSRQPADGAVPALTAGVRRRAGPGAAALACWSWARVELFKRPARGSAPGVEHDQRATPGWGEHPVGQSKRHAAAAGATGLPPVSPCHRRCSC